MIVFTGALTLLLVALSACGDDESGDVELTGQNPADEHAGQDLDSVRSVEELVALIGSPDREALRGHRFEIDAWITAPPSTHGAPSTPPQGCPVVPEKQDWLTDDPIDAQIEIAGAVIPNERLADDIPVLRLVVPYTLGFVEIPERATLRGYVLDPEHSDCPRSETLFVLDDVVDALPADRPNDEAELIAEWDQISSDLGGLVLQYPDGWDVEQQDTGVSERIRFLGPDPFRTIRLEVQDGETFWHPDANDGGSPPDVLGGERQEPAFAGQAHARLIDDRRRTSSDEREIRLVFNHQGRTIALAMVLRDGAALDTESIWVFSEMAYRMHLRGDVTMSDPMDPILAASDEIGEGPFLSEADARYVAVNASGMSAADAVDATLVSERDARNAVDGACRNFDGRPSGVWLVTVDGITPSGRDAYRLVYLDASNGTRLCQTEAPGVS